MATRPPLQLHLLAHPKSEGANELASALMRRFVEPPASGGLRIPVFFTPDRGDDRPPEFDPEGGLNLDVAEHTIVVVLADERMLRTVPSGTGDAWVAFVRRAIELAPLDASPHHVLPVALEPEGFRLSDKLHVLPATLADGSKPQAAERRLADISFHVAARAIQLLAHGKVPALAPNRVKAPVTIFLSHAKADLDPKHHEDPVRQTRAVLNELPVEQWYDAQEIATSQDFADAISAGNRDLPVPRSAPGPRGIAGVAAVAPQGPFPDPADQARPMAAAQPIETITISFSESDDARKYGLSKEHFDTLTEEIHLYLLLAGLKIAYGGALKGSFSGTSNFRRARAQRQAPGRDRSKRAGQRQ